MGTCPSNAYEARMKYAPNASGVFVGDLVFPTEDLLQGNETCDIYCARMQFINCNAIEFWYSELVKEDTNPYQEISSWLASRPLHAQSYLIPAIRYVNSPEKRSVELMTVNELCILFNTMYVQDFAVYIFTLITFGLFLNEFVATTVLEIENLNEFVASRLFQGYLDGEIFGVSDGGGFVGLSYNKSEYDSQPFYQKISGEINPAEYESLLRQQKQLADKSFFIGNNTDNLIAMHDLTEMKYADNYVDYLKQNSPFKKVGYKMFNSITRGSSRRKDNRPIRASIPTKTEYALPIAESDDTENESTQVLKIPFARLNQTRTQALNENETNYFTQGVKYAATLFGSYSDMDKNNS